MNSRFSLVICLIALAPLSCDDDADHATHDVGSDAGPMKCKPGARSTYFSESGPCAKHVCTLEQTALAVCLEDGIWGECECLSPDALNGVTGGTGGKSPSAGGAGGSKPSDGSGGSKPSGGSGGSIPNGGSGGGTDGRAGTDAGGCAPASESYIASANKLCPTWDGDDPDLIPLKDGDHLSCSTDDAYGLIWQGTIDATKGFTHQQALDYCKQLSRNGREWRLPCFSEMTTLWRFSETLAPNAALLPDDKAFWTATQKASNTAEAITFDIVPNDASSLALGVAALVRCVSSAPAK